MTLMLFEMKRSRVSLAIWTAAIALLLVICLVIFPDMKSQVNELNRTAEYLLTHPVSRSRIVFEKLLCISCQILILNAVSILTSMIVVRAIGESLQMKEFLLLHAAYLLLQAEIAAVCFAISAALRRSGIGAGLGLAAILYFLNIIANITEDAEWLKYITPFGYAEAADIITNAEIAPLPAAIGCFVTAAGIAAAFIIYNRKDIL